MPFGHESLRGAHLERSDYPDVDALAQLRPHTPTYVHASRRPCFHALRGLALSASLGLTTLSAGCVSTALPCMQYQPQTVTRAVSMRGYGAVMVTEEAMVCTHRAGSMEEGLPGP